jgi:hypothetical protein
MINKKNSQKLEVPLPFSLRTAAAIVTEHIPKGCTSGSLVSQNRLENAVPTVGTLTREQFHLC